MLPHRMSYSKPELDALHEDLLSEQEQQEEERIRHMPTEQKIQVGERVLLPNGKEATVKEATNRYQEYAHLPEHERQNFPDEWEYHVSFPSQGLGGCLNYKESELRVWRPDPESTNGAWTPQQP